MCGENGCANCSKFCLCSTNFIIAIIGLVLMIVAIWARGTDTMGPIIEKVPAVGTLFGYVIALGVLTFIFAAVGCIGSLMRQKYILGTYAALLLIMIIVKLVIAIVLFVKAAKHVSDDVIDMLQVQFDDKPELFVGVEALLKCCGVTGVETYHKKSLNPSIACCGLGTNSLPGMCTADKAFPGCESKLWPVLQPAYKNLAWILLVMVSFELIMLLITLYLIWDVLKEEGIID